MKLYKYTCIAFIPIILGCSPLKASDKDSSVMAKDVAFYEFLGFSRSVLSVNYEKVLLHKKNISNFTVRSGIGYVPGINDIHGNHHRGILSVPLVLSFHFGRKRNFGKVAFGYTKSFGSNWVDSSTAPPSIYQKHESAIIASIGYRHYFNGNLILDLFPALQWTNNPSNDIPYSFGFVIGYIFKPHKNKESD